MRIHFKILSFIIAALLSPHLSAAASLNSLQKNNEAISNIEKENLPLAEQNLLQSMAEDPYSPIQRLNLGLVYEVGKNYDKAIKEYEAVLRMVPLPDELRFIANFNAGNAAAQNENIDLALSHYQAALDVQPDSKEVKTNIELLFKGGQGQGKGKGKNKNKKQDGQGQGDDEQNKDQNKEPNPQGQNDSDKKEQQKPKFASEKLSKEDVRKILEELKNQEQRIRALEYGSKSKEKAPEKDW